MPLGSQKVALMGTSGAAVSPNYFGDGSLGDCQFGASDITQSGDSTAIDTVLSTGSESGGPGSNSYGGVNVPNTSACYELSVVDDSGYDADMVVANFTNLTIDASVTLTTKETCRGLLCYVKGDCTINGALSLSMSARGGYSNPTTSGGSDSAVVDTDGIQLGLVVDGASETLAAATFAGCGDAAVAAVANQDALDSNGTIFAISKIGGAGASSYSLGNSYYQRGNSGTAGATGANTISTAGGGSGGAFSATAGAGGAGGAFSGGPGSGAAMQQGGSATSGSASPYGAAGGNGAGNWGGAKGAGNPGGAANYSGVGGIIWLLVDGDLTIGAAGSIEADGSGGGVGTSNPGCGAAGSGGGAIFALYAGTLTNNGSIHSTYGHGGGNGGGSVTNGGHGGEGGVQTAQIDGS